MRHGISSIKINFSRQKHRRVFITLTTNHLSGDLNMPFQDQTLVCADCKNNFIFTAGEQEFFSTKGFSNTPKRCLECRSERKAQFNAKRQSKPSGGGGGQKFQKRSGSPQRFPAVCTRCSAHFEAPFQPKEGLPVLCRDCFDASKGKSRGGMRKSA